MTARRGPARGRAAAGSPRASPRASARISRTSLKDIAAITGFSITTVSMVLNGRAAAFNISDETRDLVLRAAEEHHYQPNLHARSLRSRTTGILGLVVPQLSNPFFGEMAQVFEQLARAEGRLPLITVTHFDAAQELSATHYFLSQNVECLFTANLMALRDVSELCTRAGVAQILLDSEESAKPTFSTDNRGAARAATLQLLDSLRAAGRPGRVYFLGGPREHQVTRQRVEGFRDALRERGAPWDDDQFVPAPFDPEPCGEAIRALFGSRDDVAGLFLNALAPVDGLVRFYGDAPERLRALHYAALDLHPISLARLVDLRMLVVHQDPEQMMRRAYSVFSEGTVAAAGGMHHVPYQLVPTPSMEPFLERAGRPPP